MKSANSPLTLLFISIDFHEIIHEFLVLEPETEMDLIGFINYYYMNYKPENLKIARTRSRL